MRKLNKHKPYVAYFDNLGVFVENRKQALTEHKHKHRRRAECNSALDKTNGKCFFATLHLACAVILTDKGRTRLTESVEYIIGYNLDIERRTRSRHYYSSEAVDSRLNNYV